MSRPLELVMLAQQAVGARTSPGGAGVTFLTRRPTLLGSAPVEENIRVLKAILAQVAIRPHVLTLDGLPVQSIADVEQLWAVLEQSGEWSIESPNLRPHGAAGEWAVQGSLDNEECTVTVLP